MQWHICGLLFVLAGGMYGGALAAAPSGNPGITAQGFAIETTHGAAAGQFEPVRVRVEAPERIAKLLISQGAFAVDLATTPDRTLFGLFGLDQRPLNAFDITLDFAPYMNSRFTEPGRYVIEITVIDREGGRMSASLFAEVVSDANDEVDQVEDQAGSPRLRESDATLRRMGTGGVESDRMPGLDWVTIEPVDVTIRLRAAEANATLYAPGASSWTVANQDQLAMVLADAPSLDYIDIPTARNQAAGTIIAIGGDGNNVLIRLTGSATSVSSVGTTVTLTASVRR